MQEIERVSISGISFLLDGDAYRLLGQYIDRLHAAWDGNPDGGEIVADIEARIAEILLSKQEPGSVVAAPLVEGIVARLGLPDETPVEAVPERTFSRRLYRNPEGAKLGGVCSGLGVFFDTDPLWFRLGIFIPLFLLILTGPLGWGASALFGMLTFLVPCLYLLLWFVVPSARTPRQKLEMRGERITASSIGENFRQTASPDPRVQKSATVWAEIVYAVGRIALFAIKAVALLMALGLVIAAALMAVALFVAFVPGYWPSWGGHGLTEWMPALEGISPGAYIALTLLVGLMPVVMVAVLLFRLVFEKSANRRALSVMGGIWLIVLVFWGVTTVRNSQILIDRLSNPFSATITPTPGYERNN